MVVENLLYIIVLIALIAGAYTDFKKREVADWLNFGLIFLGIGSRLIMSLLYSDWTYILYGLLGLGAMFLVALLMFYTGQWGGGDAKMVMGLGAMIGLELSVDAFLISFFINTLIFGALFGLGFSLYLAIRHWKTFNAELSKLLGEKKKQRWIYLATAAALVIAAACVQPPLRATLAILAVLVLFTYYAFIYLKAVEKSSMFRKADPEELVEGDWIVEDIIVAGKRICGPKDLGVSEEQIAQLIKLKNRGKIKRILVKDGFPFVPGFLLAFIATYLWGNVLFLALGMIIT